MRKDIGLIAVTVLLLTALGCGGSASVEMTPTPIDAAVPTVTSTPTTGVSAPTSTPGPTDTPQPTAEGRICGVLVDQSTHQGVQDIELVLFPNDPATGGFGVPLMPSVVTDAQGAFLFDHVPPGRYSLFSMTWAASWDDQLGNMFIIEVQPGETTDLGQIEVQH